MATDYTNISLTSTIKDLKNYPFFNRNTLFLLKEFGACNMMDILTINPYEFRNNPGVGPATFEDLYRIRNKFGYLLRAGKEESAKLLDKAAQICVSKHAGQRDKMGCAYFLHPMRVAMRCCTDEEKMVALLHDTIEDTDVTAEYLLDEGFPQSVVDGILSVTKREDESYEDFVARAKQNPLGRIVKLHDLEDNLDVMRLDEVTPDMAARFTKYLAARQFLLAETEHAVAPAEPDDAHTDDTAYQVSHVIMSKSDSFRRQRALINQRLKSHKKVGKTDFMQYKLSIIMPDRTIIADTASYSSFIKFVEYVGLQRIADLDMKYGQYPLVTKEPIGGDGRYAKANASWYVLKNWPTIVAAQYINDIADVLDLFIEADIVPK